MKKINKLIKLFFALAITVSFSVKSEAKEQGIGYEVRPIFPSTQLDRNTGYYYLQTEPNVKQNFELSVLNISDKTKKLEIIMENAISTTNGNIDYNKDMKRVHKSLKDPITQIVKPKEARIEIEAGKEEVVHFDVTPPEKSYDGLKMGRVVVKEKSDDKKAGINQVYQYAVGVITSESGKPFNDGDKLTLGTVEANIDNGSKVIGGEIVNPEPKTIEKLKVRSYVTKKGDNKKLKEKNIDNFSFAPNSKVNYLIPWGLSDFETGEYTFYFDAENEFETFKLKQDFKIRADDAKNLNNEAAFSVGTPTKIKIIIIAINAVLIILCTIIIVRNKKWGVQLKAKNKKRNRKKGKKLKR